MVVLSATAAVSGCAGEQSWLDTAGRDAEAIATLFWIVVPGALVIWAGVMLLAVIAARSRPERTSPKAGGRLILWGGLVFPTMTVLALLVSGLTVLDDITGRAADFRVSARGEQWWWRIAHLSPEGEPIPTPNELRLPAGRTAEIELTANRVIHSFWVPSLGGKMDMIPGRTNRITLTPDRTGEFRGQCAEYCGGAHAQMAFRAVVMEPDDFETWLAGQAEPAREPASDAARRGRDLFLASGCGACHAIRGTEAAGRVGPDLTHVGSRTSLGAATLPMTAEAMRRWIAETDHVKPGVRMPQFGMLPAEDIALIADYLLGLE